MIFGDTLGGGSWNRSWEMFQFIAQKKQYSEKNAKSITVCLHIAISTALDDQRVWLQFAYPPQKVPQLLKTSIVPWERSTVY